MKKMFIMLLTATSLLGCSPNHTLKEVVHHPDLVLPSDSPIMQTDQWMRENLW